VYVSRFTHGRSPIGIADDDASDREQPDLQLRGDGHILVYRAMLGREGVEGPGDVSVVGDEASVNAQLARLASIGATDLVAIASGHDGDRRRALEHLASINGSS
jgi:hypothetical protein